MKESWPIAINTALSVPDCNRLKYLVKNIYIAIFVGNVKGAFDTLVEFLYRRF